MFVENPSFSEVCRKGKEAGECQIRPRSRKTDAMKWKHIPVTLSHSAGKIKRDNVGHWRLETPKPLALCVDLMPRSLFGIPSFFHMC
ncbi:hypothetical protein CEXT_638561 [Caerostris extrusa]|uniref:Uncharacterized protein n=1 Tax=Caerostris extrusa TaxID=172846 RepID=A0AAV4QUN2_CAEEX|nr:hypothetical protein CEXT_638561 [Caerostris extrusa]